MDYNNAPPPVKFLHKSKVVGGLEKLASTGPLSVALIGPPGSGKTTLAFWIAVDILMSMGRSYEDAVKLILDNHPYSLPDLVRRFYMGVNCGAKPPIFFLDDALPNWFSLMRSGEGQAFWVSFLRYHRMLSDLLFITMQRPNTGMTPERVFYVTKVISGGGRVMTIASRWSRFVNREGSLKYSQTLLSFPWRRDFALPSSVAEAVEAAKSNLLRLPMKPRELNRLIRDAAGVQCR